MPDKKYDYILSQHPEERADNDNVKGIGFGLKDGITSVAYDGRPDPLNSSSKVANKPGSSIPSIFARMLFFDTAFRNAKVADASTIYGRLVSQCLDLFELIFDRGSRLTYVKWNKAEQIKMLKNSHPDLYQALITHTQTYLNSVKTIYLIFDKDKGLMGATSPYTFVFTSPNFVSEKTAKPLLKRNTEFIKYMFRLHAAFDSLDLRKEDKKKINGILNYIGRCIKASNWTEADYKISNGAGGYYYTLDDLRQDYHSIKIEEQGVNNKSTINIAEFYKKNLTTGVYTDRVDVPLLCRNPSKIKSDLFIKSNIQPFSQEKTPMLLTNQYNGSLIYYDTTPWQNDEIYVPQDANPDEVSRDLPECQAYSHIYLTDIDFFEDKLIALPYAMDEANFKFVINKKDRSYLLPIKSLLLKYFSIDDLGSIIVIDNDSDSDFVTVALNIPVCDQNNQQTGVVTMYKSYDVTSTVDTVKVDKKDGVPFDSNDEDNAVSVGISPFIRLSDRQINKLAEKTPELVNKFIDYTVMLQTYDMQYAADIDLDFYCCGDKQALEDGIDVKVGDRSVNKTLISKFYRVMGCFDGIQLRLIDGDVVKSAGMIIPDWRELGGNTVNTYVYGIDFGTTNTHVAFVRGTEDARSFDAAGDTGAAAFNNQVVYLAQRPRQVDSVGNSEVKQKRLAFAKWVYGEDSKVIFDEQARLFYPNYLYDPSNPEYKFPIRTVTSQIDTLDENSQLFLDAGVGFRYTRELLKLDKYNYHNDVKWALESPKSKDIRNASTINEAQYRARIFFQQIIEMIRNHWLNQEDADVSNAPEIVLTYPLSMKNVSTMQDLWVKAYAKVFKVDESAAKKKFHRMAESLAPAINLLTKQGERTEGALNVDIGGGTTDIQFYREDTGDTISNYTSVRFAGDNLWGRKFENVSGMESNNDSNIFTRFASNYLGDLDIDLGNEKKDRLSDIKINSPKEIVNVLLRDANRHFANALRDARQELAHKAVMLHYGALIYHLANWMMADPRMIAKFPKTICFTGFGSKYIDTIFGSDEEGRRLIRQYTLDLFRAFCGDKVTIPDNIKIVFPEEPKALTAEGAAANAVGKGKDLKRPKEIKHLGYDGYQLGDIKRQKDLIDTDLKERVIKYFDNFVKLWNNIDDPDLEIVPMTDRELKRLYAKANTSLNEMINNFAPSSGEDEAGQIVLGDSLFFWMLLGAIADLDID